METKVTFYHGFLIRLSPHVLNRQICCVCVVFIGLSVFPQCLSQQLPPIAINVKNCSRILCVNADTIIPPKIWLSPTGIGPYDDIKIPNRSFSKMTLEFASEGNCKQRLCPEMGEGCHLADAAVPLHCFGFGLNISASEAFVLRPKRSREHVHVRPSSDRPRGKF